MPINTDLNISPYYDDYDIENQFYKVLFKPAYAVQARELTQLQTILQNQIEQFGDNIFKEGSIIKGSTFTNLNDLKYVKLNNKTGFDPELYKPVTVVEDISGVDTEVDIIYQVEGLINGLKANIISAQIGYETRPPDLNTFWVNYLNANEDVVNADYRKVFQEGEELNIIRYKFVGGQPHPTAPGPDIVQTCNVTDQVNATGNAFGIQSAPGIVFQKGHFLFTSTQTLIVEKYSNAPNDVSVGYKVQEELIDSLGDSNLFDNALGSKNYNAPGADRLKLTPILTVLPTATANSDKDFFTLIRYQNGDAVLLRDVSQYNVIGEEMAKRTYEESGNYVVEKFNVVPDRRNGDLTMLVNPGVAYVKGHRVENKGQQDFRIDPVTTIETTEAQPINQSYGGYVDIVAFGGTNTSIPDIDNATYDLQDASNVDIGQAWVRNITPTKIYLSGINMVTPGKTFADVKYIQTGGGNGDHIEIAEGSVFKDADRFPAIFDTGTYSLESTDNITIVKRLKELKSPASATSMQITILNTADENFDCNNDDILIIQSDGTLHTVTDVVVNVNNSVLTITTSTNMTNTCYVYYNKRFAASPYAKSVATPYIKTTYNPADANQKWALGFPDVFEIKSIVDVNGKEWKNSFRLKPNQKDTHYGKSYYEHVAGRPKPASGTLTVHLGVFEVNPNDDYFFTIDSYPIDNSETPAVGFINTNRIPVYTSSSGRRYNLRECFDFRPYVNKVAGCDYTDTIGTAETLSIHTESATGLNTVSLGTLITPANDNTAEADMDYYLSRIDHITVDTYGQYAVIKGTEEENPRPAKIDPNQLVISTVSIPGFPALTPKEAARQGKNYYAVTAKANGVKNYTMKDIQRIDNKIQAIEYQVLLSQLENEVQNLNILDENGLTRFKNGYIVEPFKDLQLANLEDTNFNASVPFDKEILAPAVRTFPLDLKLKSNTNATIFPDTASPEVATLSRNSHVSLISQTFATGFRNAVSNFYKYSGVGRLSPDHDGVHDTVADPINIVSDFSAPFNNFLENLQEFLPLTGTEVTTFQKQIGNAAQWFPTTVTKTKTSTLVMNEGTSQNFSAGDMVSNFHFEPYMRSRDVNVYMSGLRPNTRHYFFFDGVSVDVHVMPGTEVDSAREVERFGVKGAEVKTDANGVLRAVFNVPAETFFVGDRELEVVDVNQYASIDSASTSYGSLMYHAFNINVEKTNITGSVRIPSFDINTTTTERNGPRRARPRERNNDRNNDPLAQTFFIKEGMGKGSGSVFASKVDLYFKKKSTTNGVNVELREVVNGYPSAHIIPFSQVHLTPAQVSATEDASTATTVDFEAPVRLDVEKEYAVVIKPDANDPNYLVFTSKVGQTDITPGNVGAAVVQDWGDGVLFTSTNNRAWKSYQDEDIKFNLYRHDFNASTGSVVLSPEDLEFFSISERDGEFLAGEKVFQQKALSGATIATVSGTLGSDFVTGTAVNETYAAGMSVIIKDSTNTFRDIFKIASVDSATQVTLNKKLPFVVTSGTMLPCVDGSVNYFNVFSDEVLYLRKSTADTTLQFQGVDVTLSSSLSAIEGLDSRATAVIDSVDNINVSYVQPMILKSNDAITTTTLAGQFNDPANSLQNYNLPMKFADNNYFNKKGNLLYSKSNDTGNTKPFDLTINMANKSNSTSTPIVDLETASLIAYQYKSTNSADTTCKYISKTIELKESLDAEDFNVILTGYRPNGTDIKVYIRPINAHDYTDEASIDWIELELYEGLNLFSSSSNINDYKEFSYRVPSANLDSGVLTYSTALGEYLGFRKFAVRIDLLSSNNYQVPYVADYRGIALT